MGYADDINLLIKEHIDATQLYHTNDHIFTEGDPFRGVYYILEGSVKIFKSSRNQSLMLWVGEPNEFIGITSYFDTSDNYKFTAEATQLNCKLIEIPADKFSKSLDKIPGIKKEIIKAFCKRINFVELRINNFIQHGTRKRFIDTINFIYKHSPGQNQSLQKTTLKYSMHDLSEMVGTSTKTLNNLVKEFEHDNLLHIQGDNLVIHDINKLRGALKG